MQIVNGKIKLEAGDKIKLKDGRYAEFIEFNVWDTGLVYVNINWNRECIFTSELDLDSLK